MSAAGDDADICLIVEGAYPYVAGGVSNWAKAVLIAIRGPTFSQAQSRMSSTPADSKASA